MNTYLRDEELYFGYHGDDEVGQHIDPQPTPPMDQIQIINNDTPSMFPVIEKLNKEFETAQDTIIKLEKLLKQQQDQINALIKTSCADLYKNLFEELLEPGRLTEFYNGRMDEFLGGYESS